MFLCERDVKLLAWRGSAGCAVRVLDEDCGLVTVKIKRWRKTKEWVYSQ
jgi:hypothetical protein